MQDNLDWRCPRTSRPRPRKRRRSTAEATKTLATAEAESNKIKAVGVRNIGEAEAAVITMKNEAQNKFGSNVIDFEIAKKRIETMPSALAEMVRPIANFKDVTPAARSAATVAAPATEGAPIYEPPFIAAENSNR